MRLTLSIVAAALLLAPIPLVGQAFAQTPATAPAVEAATQAILANPKVIKTLDDIKADDDRPALAEQKRITEISGAALTRKDSRRIFPETLCRTGFMTRMTAKAM